ncbi:hypothetical protein QR680_017866 [Steinernema hermaphroditum]|uniref:Nuclear receptor domain-containing protein n=1 Tax=Steinernema hermaphroditum TaxID=289476 RepID=A0AA39LPW3_9BILA|nr:hypothetical protein QR680_017866 [Steinernema hermaphroditum]
MTSPRVCSPNCFDGAKETAERVTIDLNSTDCLVCGYKAKCCNYGVPTCNSCKSFFRRCVMAGTIYKCLQAGDCRVERGDMACRACRFQKCLKLGMKANTISGRTPTEQLNEEKMNSKIPTGVLCPLAEFDIDLKNLLYIENRIQRIRYSSFFPYGNSKRIKDFLYQPCALNKADRYTLMSSFPRAPDWVTFDETLAEKGHKQWPYLDTILAIEYFKVLSVFRRLSERDKLALVKGTVIQISMFHGAYDSFCRGHFDTIVQPDGYRNLAQPYFQYDGLAKIARVGILPFLRGIGVREEHFAILKAIIALNSAAPNLSEGARDLISEEREKHVNLLMKLIRMEGVHEWIGKFVRIFDLVNRNLKASEAMQNLFFAKYIPILSTNVSIAALWIEIYLES